MSGIAFREATAADLPAIIAMLADDQLGTTREVVSDPPDPRYIDAFNAIGADPNQSLIVADDGGTVAGAFQLSFLPGLSHSGAWRGQIEAVRVARSHRGAGLGEAMMRHATALCRTKGCRMVQLTSNATRTDAHRFYERLGFQPTHTGFKLVF